MTIKTVHTRVYLRYDTHDNWLASDQVLGAGEVAFGTKTDVNEGDIVLIKVGDGKHKYSELPFASAKASDVVQAAKSEDALRDFINNITADIGIIDVTSLPTSNISERSTYRVLIGTCVLDRLPRNDSTCHIVEWDSVPSEPGESVLNNNNGVFSYTGYYNVKNNTVYGYFGTDTISELKTWVDESSLNSLVKIALKTALDRMSAGWKTMEEILSLIGTAMSLSWGGVITSIDSAANQDALYLYLSSEMFFYKNNTWVSTNSGIGMPGSGIGAEIFNDPNNVATGVGAHAEGRETTATGEASHAEGYQTIAEGKISHAEGESSVASGIISHAEGYYTEASGEYSHAEGFRTVASGLVAHAQGIGTIASAQGETVIGQYNEVYEDESDLSFVIGNGADDNNRSNAVEIGKAGWAWFAGDIDANGDVYTQDGKLASESYVDEKISSFSGSYVTAGRLPNSELGQNATAEGLNNISSGITAHTEGTGNEASGHYAHAEGYLTKATGLVAHAEGWGTIASGAAQHVQGKFNADNPNAAFILGNGSSDAARSNAVEVDWNGNANFKGTVSSDGKALATQESVAFEKLPDRPFYVRYNIGDTVFTATATASTNSTVYDIGDNNSFVVGQDYFIQCYGHNNVRCLYVKTDSIAYEFIKYDESGVLTDEVIARISGASLTVYHGYLWGISHAITISSCIQEVKCLDEKYIP